MSKNTITLQQWVIGPNLNLYMKILDVGFITIQSAVTLKKIFSKNNALEKRENISQQPKVVGLK
jgi:hypothetical protein